MFNKIRILYSKLSLIMGFIQLDFYVNKEYIQPMIHKKLT